MISISFSLSVLCRLKKYYERKSSKENSFVKRVSFIQSMQTSYPRLSMIRVLLLTCAISMCMLSTVAWACESDDDCRPSSCCHSTMCVDTTKAPAPNCSDVMCTAGCIHDTLDCGGECRCSASTKVCSPFIRAGMPPEGAGPWGIPPPLGAPSNRRIIIVRVKKSGK